MRWLFEIARHLPLESQVRTFDDLQSSPYNTDCQIFSDIGAPVVLFMENYDINRTGYHDSKDTPENIDLDFYADDTIGTYFRPLTLPQSTRHCLPEQRP